MTEFNSQGRQRGEQSNPLAVEREARLEQAREFLPSDPSSLSRHANYRPGFVS
jgi:hypothetical protein